MSKETIAVQWTGYAFVPYTPEDTAKAKCFPVNKIVDATIEGAKQAPSLRQNNTFYSACSIVSENSDDKQWQHPEDVVINVKMICRHVRIVIEGDKTYAEPRSLSFDKFPDWHERNVFFNRAFEVLADKIGLSVEELMEAVKRRAAEGKVYKK